MPHQRLLTKVKVRWIDSKIYNLIKTRLSNREQDKKSNWGSTAAGNRHLPPGGILQKRYLRGCRQCCRLSDSLCPLLPVPLVSHLHNRAAAACPLKTTSTTYIIILHLILLHSSNQSLKWLNHTQPRSPHLGRGPQMSPGRTAPLLMTSSVLTLPLILLLSISATFVALDLIYNMWNTISPPLNLIFSS